MRILAPALALLAALCWPAAAPPALAASPAGAADASPNGAGETAATTSSAARSAWIEAVVLGVDDGDSFVARRPDGGRIRVRLAGIDAPEKSQPWAAAARRKLRETLDGRALRITPLKTDRWGRYVALVDADGEDPALAMLEAGLAWHFARYDRDLPERLRPIYAQAASEARERRAGLWQQADPEPPWEFRQRSR
ncbi:thermonuclease family protein [Burkholderiaceae bacterium FT117]|uniref:thermonuclease family protein n=1 Tax=Zeimonas sediminis TaxID=2944268 RepID=UPI002342FF79|nr:thermonuclease family protein [Zeimonas sediminis]MCM5571919.1 thermonuclease family protein [Zeimonas sediminis]